MAFARPQVRRVSGVFRWQWLLGVPLVVALLVLTGHGLGVPSGSAHVVATPFCTTTGSYIVCTDQDDYVPSSTVHLSGSGFASSAAVTIKITRPDSSVVKSDGTPGSDDLTTSTGGSFQYDYALNGLFGVYLVEVLAGTAPGGTLLATHLFSDASIDFRQCRNDSNNDNVIDDCEWTNGGINQNNGIYSEGQAVPQRLFHALDQAGTHTMGFKYQFSQGDVYAYDFLTNVDETMTAGALLNECADLPGFVSGANCTSLFSGPDTNTDLVDIPTDPFDSVAARENPPGAGARQFTVGCVPACTSISSTLVFPSINGGDDPGEAHLPDSDLDCFQDCGNSDVQIELTFETSTTDTLVGVWFGGHLAETADPSGTAIGWDAICNITDCGAASVSGAPYHLRYVCVKEPSDPGACGSPSTSVGSRDNQIQGGTIIVEGAPATATNTATATATPTATTTPPPNPRMAKLPAVQNVWLTRQGAKIPPGNCLAGTDLGGLTEQLSQTITSPDPKNPSVAQQIGAFEFEVHYDATKVCVDLSPGAGWDPFSTNPNAPAAGEVICIIEDSQNKPALEGVARMGCLTVGKGLGIDELAALAQVNVYPQPDVYSQAKPNQDNGVVVQINNVGCDVGDEQGHAIKIFSCDDADITFRYLEGDVEPDCLVDAIDAQTIAFRWGSEKGSTIYKDFMNLEPSGTQADNDIDINDLQFVFGRFGSTCSAPHPPQPPVNLKS